jgi:hypothetical protein
MREEIERKDCIYVSVLRPGIYTTLTGGSECVYYKGGGLIQNIERIKRHSGLRGNPS